MDSDEFLELSLEFGGLEIQISVVVDSDSEERFDEHGRAGFFFLFCVLPA